MSGDTELLRRYVEEHSEAAFAELVRLHLNLVYFAALRQLGGDAHRAQEVTQTVFTDLARKARSLTGRTTLTGWLHTSTRLAAAMTRRADLSRRRLAARAETMQATLQESGSDTEWERLRPMIDEVIHELSERDRDAVLLRFFEGRPFAEIGATLGLSEDAARMRVDRALGRLRSALQRRGVISTTTAMAAVFATQANAAAPDGLAATVAETALASVGVGGGLAGILMIMTKQQLGMVGALVVFGTTSFVLQAEANAQLRAELDRLRSEKQHVETSAVENQRVAMTAPAQSAVAATKSAGDSVAVGQTVPAVEVFDAANIDRPPRPRFQAKAKYPPELRVAGVSGEVVVDLVVDDQGNSLNVHAVQSSHPAFEASAISSVRKWKYVPPRHAGKWVYAHLQQSILFDASRDAANGIIGPSTIPEIALPKPVRLNPDPTPLAQLLPVYPIQMANAGANGAAIVRFTIAASGEVSDVSLDGASTRELEEPALGAVRQWRFAPLDGPVRAEVTLVFDSRTNRQHGVPRALHEPMTRTLRN